MGKKQLTNFDIRRNLPADVRLVVADQAARLGIKYVYEGLITYQQDTGAYWKYIGTPPSNLSGDWEEGIGEKGEPGTSIFTGTTDPDDLDGNNGDFYFQTQDGASYSAGDWFEKSAGTWGMPIFNTVGPQGPAGADGTNLPRYGGLYTHGNGGGTAQDLTNASQYYKIEQWLSSTISEGTTPSTVNNNIVIDEPGVYQVTFDVSYEGTGNGADYQIAVFLNGVEQESISSEHTFNAATVDVVTSSAGGILSLVATDTIDIRVKSSVAGADFLLTYGNIGITTVGNQGAQGKAFVVTPGWQDETLTDSDVTTIEGLTATEQNPIVVSVLSDLRSTATKTSMGLSQSVGGHTIQWDGSTWYDNGTWRGPQGPQGVQGPQGADGADGVANGMSEYLNDYFTSISGVSLPSSPSFNTAADISVTAIRGKFVVITGDATFFNDGNDVGIIGLYSNTSSTPITSAAAQPSGISQDVNGRVFWKGTISNSWSSIRLGLGKIQQGSSGLLKYRDALLEIKVLN